LSKQNTGAPPLAQAEAALRARTVVDALFQRSKRQPGAVSRKD